MTRTAIATDANQVSEHFGRCPEYTIVDLENGSVVNRTTVTNPGHEPGVIPRFLDGHHVDAIVCGGIGSRARQLFDEYGIEVVAGIVGSVEDVIEALIAGKLQGGESLCSHGESHSHHDGGCEH